MLRLRLIAVVDARRKVPMQIHGKALSRQGRVLRMGRSPGDPARAREGLFSRQKLVSRNRFRSARGQFAKRLAGIPRPP